MKYLVLQSFSLYLPPFSQSDLPKNKTDNVTTPPKTLQWFLTVAGLGELVAGREEMSLENHGTQSTPGWKRYIGL